MLIAIQDVTMIAGWRWLTMQTQHNEQGAVECIQGVSIKLADHTPYAVAPERSEFVGHELRPEQQAVTFRWFDDGPQHSA
jgi:hypothetical protein